VCDWKIVNKQSAEKQYNCCTSVAPGGKVEAAKL